METVKQIVGIDIAKDGLVACYGELTAAQDQSITRSKTFSNADKGHRALLRWANKLRSSKTVDLWFVMEATGVYYENLAYFLSKVKHKVAVLLPNKTKNYVRTLNTKTKTDSVDAKMLTQYGLERPLNPWQVPSPILRDLKALVREYQTLHGLRTRIRNQKHAKDRSFAPRKETLRRMNQQINLLQSQLVNVKNEMLELVKTDATLHNNIERICKIDGVGFITVLSIIGETNGFAIIENGKQLTSYAGLDIVHNQSGKRFGKTSISKKGNKFLRHAVYMPALSACKCNDRYKQLYERLTQNNKPKKVAITAVSRKLLLLIYALWKSGAEYSPNYQTAAGQTS